VVDDEIQVEFFPNRPDLFSVEGAARAIKDDGLEKGLPAYATSPSGIEIGVDPSVNAVRPHVVAPL